MPSSYPNINERPSTFKPQNSVSNAGAMNAVTMGISGAASGAAIGATFGGAGGPIGMGVGAAIGIIVGGIMGAWQESENQKAQYYITLNNRAEATANRNRNIRAAQSLINSTRVSFDSIYGEGMYDEYDALFQAIFNLPTNSDGIGTVSDLLESLSFDSVSGKIESSVIDQLSENAFTGAMSIQDINAEYLNYMKQQIHTADTVLGLQFEANTSRENQMISAYFDSVDQYNLQLAQQFDQAFLQYRTENIQNEMSEGEAALSQATSGLRQTGTGTNLTAMQQFQTDLANVAYAAALNYQVRAYELSMNAANTDLVNEIYQIRNENAVTTQQALVQSINQYLQFRDQLTEYYGAIKDDEEAIYEMNQAAKDQSDAAWGMDADEGFETLDPEDMF